MTPTKNNIMKIMRWKGANNPVVTSSINVCIFISGELLQIKSYEYYINIYIYIYNSKILRIFLGLHFFSLNTLGMSISM